MLYRDDDIGKYTDLSLIQKIHSLFVRYNRIHTVSILMDDLWESKAVWFWLQTTPNLDITLHGWKHVDYSKINIFDLRKNIKQCLDYWEENSKRAMDVYEYKFKLLKVFYPPWNKTSPALYQVCSEVGLEVSVKNRVSNPGEVYDFHWWECVNDEYFKKLVRALDEDWIKKHVEKEVEELE